MSASVDGCARALVFCCFFRLGTICVGNLCVAGSNVRWTDPRGGGRRAVDSTRTWVAVVALCALAALCSPAVGSATGPNRIVSINLCADQLVVELADREHIASVSRVALDPTVSNVVDRARGLVTNRGRLEEIIRLKPDMVVSTGHREGRVNALLRQFGVAVVELRPVDSITEAYQSVRELASLLGETARGERLVAEMQAGFAALAERGAGPQVAEQAVRASGSGNTLAVVYRPNGYTSGRHTFVNDVMVRAGLTNLGAEIGIERWGTIPLEVLLHARPALIVLDDSVGARTSLAHRSLSHPALRRLRPHLYTLPFPSRLWVCPGPWLVQAARYLAQARQRLSSGRAHTLQPSAQRFIEGAAPAGR